MKKLFLALLAVFSIALVVAGCGGDSKPAANSGDKKVVLKVGATPVPHAEILNLIKPQLAKEGVDLTAMLPILSKYVGHTGIASTQYYLKLTAEAFPDVLEQMDELTGHVFPEVGGVVYEE